MRNLTLGIFLILNLFSSSGAKANPAYEQATVELQQLNDVFNQAVVAGDADTLVNLYRHDALWIEQGNPAVKGQEAPRQLFEFVTAHKGVVTHTIDDLFIADDASQAVMIGSVVAKMPTHGMDATGTYLFVLKPGEDGWKIITDMWHQHSHPASQ